MSDTPTSVSLSKTPAARPAPITNTQKRGAHVPRRTHMCTRGERVNVYEDTRERDGRISSDFSTPDRGPVVMLN